MNVTNRKKLAVSLLSALLLTGVFATDSMAKSKPTDWDKELAKGYRDLEINNKNEAAAFFAKKCEKYPSSGACHTAYGKALKSLGKLDEAKKEFRTATQCEPTFANGFYEYACSLESDKQYKEASDNFTQYLTLSPDASKRKNIEDRIRFCQDALQ
jgi:tetratricopeptide (TPR) repeat protein